MTSLHEICDFLDQYAPIRLAEDWDNVGLLVGDKSATVARIMTCLTVTPESADEAISRHADLIVSHHPLPFHPIKKLTTETTSSRLLWNLVRAGIGIYSPHTGFDSAEMGINQMICQRIGMQKIKPLVPAADDSSGLGAGRIGQLESPTDLASFIDLVKQKFPIRKLQFVGNQSNSVSIVASACGAGGSFLEHADSAGCDTLVTGEAGFHTCLDAKARLMSLILLGHYSSERFAIEILSDVLQAQFAELEVWASEKESDPINFA